MSVTITRRNAIALGEEAVAKVKARRRFITDETPQIIAFRQVLQLGTSFLAGTYRLGEYKCPMAQTVFVDGSGYSDSITRSLAYAWDDVIFAEGLWHADVIHVNPHTEANVHGLLTEYNS